MQFRVSVHLSKVTSGDHNAFAAAHVESVLIPQQWPVSCANTFFGRCSLHTSTICCKSSGKRNRMYPSRRSETYFRTFRCCIHGALKKQFPLHGCLSQFDSRLTMSKERRAASKRDLDALTNSRQRRCEETLRIDNSDMFPI